MADLTVKQIEALVAGATPGPWRGDRNDGTVKYAILADDENDPIVVLSVDHKSGRHGFGCGYGDEESTRYAADPEADERLCIAAPDLATTALRALAEVERLRGVISNVRSVYLRSGGTSTEVFEVLAALDAVDAGGPDAS